MDGDDVGHLQQLLVIGVIFSTQSLDLVLTHEGVVTGHFHAHALTDLCGLAANGTQTDDTHGLAFQLEGLVDTADLPVALLGLHLTLVEVLGEGKHHSHGMFCHTAVVGTRGDNHGDAQLSGFLHVHGVVAHTGAANDLQFGTVLNGMGIALCDADDQGISVLHVV